MNPLLIISLIQEHLSKTTNTDKAMFDTLLKNTRTRYTTKNLDIIYKELGPMTTVTEWLYIKLISVFSCGDNA